VRSRSSAEAGRSSATTIFMDSESIICGAAVNGVSHAPFDSAQGVPSTVERRDGCITMVQTAKIFGFARDSRPRRVLFNRDFHRNCA
jgi:hypothetical protein